MNLAEIFSDGMVLQRDRQICIFGYGKGKVRSNFVGKAITLFLIPINFAHIFLRKALVDHMK